MDRMFTAALACVLAAATATAAQSASRRAEDAAERVADDPSKIVCKTFTRIGSLADRYRTCKTKAEWQRERDNLRELDRSYGCRMKDDFAEPCK